MTDIKIPVIELDNQAFQVSIDLRFYSIEAITSASYKYTDKFYIHQQISSDDENKTIVVFETKDESFTINSTIVKDFCNTLIDQQMRILTENRFGKIRDMIVEEAFKPLSK